jgi:hypothetical protein
LALSLAHAYRVSEPVEDVVNEVHGVAVQRESEAAGLLVVVVTM